jgi:hypothetical protein
VIIVNSVLRLRKYNNRLTMHAKARNYKLDSAVSSFGLESHINCKEEMSSAKLAATSEMFSRTKR